MASVFTCFRQVFTDGGQAATKRFILHTRIRRRHMAEFKSSESFGEIFPELNKAVGRKSLAIDHQSLNVDLNLNLTI